MSRKRNFQDISKSVELQNEIKDMFYIQNYDKHSIAAELNLTMQGLNKFLRTDKLSDYNDDNLEAIAMTGDYNALDVITQYFQSVHYASKELSWTAMLSEMYREEIAKIVSQQGLSALSKGDNKRIYGDAVRNAEKLGRQSQLALRNLEAYITLFEKVLDVQKEVSYIKVITDLLRDDDPELYKKITRALDRDPAAKMVLEALSREDVLHYWDADEARVVMDVIEPVRSREED